MIPQQPICRQLDLPSGGICLGTWLILSLSFSLWGHGLRGYLCVPLGRQQWGQLVSGPSPSGLKLPCPLPGPQSLTPSHLISPRRDTDNLGHI